MRIAKRNASLVVWRNLKVTLRPRPRLRPTISYDLRRSGWLRHRVEGRRIAERDIVREAR